jgi:adenine deaminase
MQRKILRNLLDVVKGIVPADAVIRNGRVINVFTNRIEDGLIVVIKDGFIVSVENAEGLPFYRPREVIDGRGRFLSPGFIDAHTHLDGMIPFHQLVPYALRGGTTTVVTETSVAACTCGMEGVTALVESTDGYPLRCYFLAPPLTPPFPDMEGSIGLTLREFNRCLRSDRFVGIGEAYWNRIVDGDRRVLSQAASAMSLGKALDGHAAGIRGRRLVEYALTGITSCHESTLCEEVLEKLRLGLYVMIRDGWVRRELEELSKVKESGVDQRRLLLVSDVFDSVMLVEEGYLDAVVRRAIRFGFSAIDAIKMVTINPADYYHLRHLGAIAPLRKADILFIDDLDAVRVSDVMADGRMFTRDGVFPLEGKSHYHYPEAMLRTLSPGLLSEADFRVPSKKQSVKIRLVDLAGETITRENIWEAKASEGFIEKDVARDILPVAVINRYNKARMGKGFIRGTGIKEGALATTLTWDTGNILTIGASEGDMAKAVNRLSEIQGGIVLSRQGEILYESAMPVFGTLSLDTMPNLRMKTKELEEKLKELGASLERPFLTMQTIAFTGLPFLRVTDKGLADIKNKRLVPLIVEE